MFRRHASRKYGYTARITYEDFIAGIDFRWLEPMNSFHGPSVMRLWHVARRLPVMERVRRACESWNTRLPISDDKTLAALRRICLMPRMSTLAIAALINEAVRRMPAEQAYLNIGTWYGFSLFSGIVCNPDKRCVGVDNFSQFDAPRERFMAGWQALRSDNHEFHDMDYERYFAEMHRGPIGVYAYDGHHDRHHQCNALRIAEPFFAPGCIIVIDDTNWPSPRDGTLKFLSQCRHSYTTLIDMRTAYSCHPTFWNGIMVLRRN